MMKKILLVVCTSLSLFTFAQKDSLILNPQMDNTIYEEGTNSNGAGSFFFIGNTATGNTRRTLIKFDLSTIPNMAVIDSVVLIMTSSKSKTGTPQNMTGHVLTSDWGEGTSNASANEGSGAVTTSPSATWIHGFYDESFWQTPGSDFLPSTWGATVLDNKTNIINASGMVNDVQAWVNGTIANYGWVLLGNEKEEETAFRFNAKENANNPPILKIYGQDVITLVSDNLSANSFEIFPNPVHEIITIEGFKNEQWSLIDVMGKRIANGTTETINISNEASGIYFLQIGEVVKRITIE